MTPFLLATAALIAFAASNLLVPVVCRFAIRFNWVDKPDEERKKHARPTPNVGGIAIFVGFAVGLGFLLFATHFFAVELTFPRLALFGGALTMAMLGVYDDIHGLSFKRKFFVQIVVAYALLHAGYRFDVSALPFVGSDPFNVALISIPLTMIWIVGIINAVNLLDGLDGLASGVSIIAFGSLAIIFGINGGDAGLIAVAVLVIGATAGFLVFNFSPASIFMGDTGSLFLGYMLAVFSLEGVGHSDPVLALMVPGVALGLPILDTGLCMVRRVIDGTSPFAPDSDHIHHRLSHLWSTRNAVLILYAVAIWFGVAALLMTQFERSVGLLMVAVTLLAAYVGIRALGYLKMQLPGRQQPLAEKQLELDFASKNRIAKKKYGHSSVAVLETSSERDAKQVEFSGDGGGNERAPVVAHTDEPQERSKNESDQKLDGSSPSTGNGVAGSAPLKVQDEHHVHRDSKNLDRFEMTS